MTIKQIIFLSMCALLIGACGGTTSDNDDAQSSAVVINHPQDSDIIYAETLYVSGQVASPPQQFTLEVLDTEDQVIRQVNVDAQTAEWTVELVHGYTGDPTEVTVQAVPLTSLSSEASATESTVIVLPYDSVAILLTDLSNRPDGVFANITTPTNGVDIGGDILPIFGRVSGTDSITVSLISSEADGQQVISEQTIGLNNPYLIDEITWQAELPTEGYTGQAFIRVTTRDPQTNAELELDRIIVTVITTAG